MQNRPPFAFFGTPSFAATILDGLLRADWKPEIVITEPAKPVGRDQILTPSAVEHLAQEARLPIATPGNKEEIFPIIEGRVLGFAIVVAYGKILPQKVIEHFPEGMINVHASLLPRWRGASPIQASLLTGDPSTGLTFMHIEPTLDTGPILAQTMEQIQPTDTTQTLSERLALLGADTLPVVLDAYLSGALDPLPQDDEHATYTSKIRRSDGEVRLHSVTADELDRKLRAYTPWPGIHTFEFGDRLILKDGYLDKERFILTQLQWEGKRPVDSATFARSYPDILTALPDTITLGGNNTSTPEHQ